MDSKKKEEIDQYFIKRGLPHFIEDYSVTKDVLSRALPVLLFIFAVELFFVGDLSGSRTFLENVLIIFGVIVFVVLSWGVSNKIRHRAIFSIPDSVGIVEVIVFICLPPVLILVAGLKLDQALVAFAVNVVLLSVLYFLTSYAVIPIVRWAIAHTRKQLMDVINLFVRSLPILVLFSVLIFLSADIWRMTSTSSAMFFVATIAAIACSGFIFAVFKVPQQISELSSFEELEVLEERLKGTPGEELVMNVESDIPELTKKQWSNVSLVVILSQGVQGLLVFIMLFFSLLHLERLQYRLKLLAFGQVKMRIFSSNLKFWETQYI